MDGRTGTRNNIMHCSPSRRILPDNWGLLLTDDDDDDTEVQTYCAAIAPVSTYARYKLTGSADTLLLHCTAGHIIRASRILRRLAWACLRDYDPLMTQQHTYMNDICRCVCAVTKASIITTVFFILYLFIPNKQCLNSDTFLKKDSESALCYIHCVRKKVKSKPQTVFNRNAKSQYITCTGF